MCGASLSTGGSPGEVVPLRPGMTLQGRYRVLEQIGEGGLGRVYLASDERGRKVVLKQIREPRLGEQVEDYDLYLRSFQREASILSSLPHPYLPIARDYVVDPESLVIVMDYIEGRTLAEVFDSSPALLPESRVIQWGIQICEALGYLHSKDPPIIHRNVKPKNIILQDSEPPRVRLIGFGLARYYVDGLERDEDNLGTQGFSPPEQYGTAQTDARSDVFGLGATMFALLSGHSPGEFVKYEGPGRVLLDFPPLSELNPEVTERTTQLVLKALNADPAERFQSAGEMRLALGALLAHGEDQPPPEKFHLGKPVPLEETRYCEFKEVVGQDPVRSILRQVETYVVAFLNSEGGRIFWGIRDHDRVVIGVKLSYRQRDQVRRTVLDKVMRVQPAVSPNAYHINFRDVYEGERPIKNLFVVEVVVPRQSTNLLYFTESGDVFMKTEAGKKKLSGTEIQDEIVRRLQKGSVYSPASKV
jgi:serine/threonine protein kinase